jgi:dinuclear metal center YbgI/SA1388 family protein
MKISNVIDFLESWAPSSYQESYDNAGLITGNADTELTNALICLDSTEAVVDEAIENKCNLIIAHHPIVFSGLKKINGKNYVEKVIIKAIKNDMAIYAIHTNLDNVNQGVSRKICDKLGLKNCRILSPKNNILKKIYTYVPVAHAEAVKQALFNAGAGYIGNYSEASFSTPGTGTFKGNEAAKPFVGEKGKQHHEKEEKIETIFLHYIENQVLAALFSSHPYEEVAYEIITLDNVNKQVGSGMIGELKKPLDMLMFLKEVKNKLKTNCIRYTQLIDKQVNKIAVCGGAGSFLLPDAIAQKADVFITADFKYHQFFDANGKIVIADIGHYESEQFTPELICEKLKEKFVSFAPLLTSINTNPINYL